MKNKEPKRMNIRIAYELYVWLEKESKRTGIAKSSLIAVAVEEYKNRKEKIMKNNEVGLSKKSYDIIKYYEKYEGLSVSQLTEYSLFLFDYLYKNNPELLLRILEDIIDDLEK